MTKFPNRRHIEPLAPAPDSFDRVLASARRRRRRKLAGASATMVVALIAAGSFALGASLHLPTQIDPAAAHSQEPNSPSPAGLPIGSPSPSTSHKKSPSPGTKTGTAPITWLHGRAVDSSDRGIAGLYVQPGRAYQRSFSFDSRTGTRTDARGYFTIACPHAPVLLSTWRVNQNYADNTAGGTWGAAFVGSTNGNSVVPRCGSQIATTTLSQGATITGQMIAHGQCQPDDSYNIWLWLGGDHDTTIRLAAVHNGDTFTYSGLPAGTHTLGVRGQTTVVSVEPGAAASANADFNCDSSTADPSQPPGGTSSPPPESPEPGSTPSPSPNPLIN